MRNYPDKETHLLGGLISLRRVGGKPQPTSNSPTSGTGTGNASNTAPARAEGNVYPRRRTQRCRQSRERARPTMAPAPAAAAAPPDWATSQAIVLVPNPDGSWVAQPANYWEYGQQSGGVAGGA